MMSPLPACYTRWAIATPPLRPHFFSPVTIMRLLETVGEEETADDVRT